MGAAVGVFPSYDSAGGNTKPVYLAAALDWATRMPAVNGGTVEVRAAISGMAWQKVLD